MNFTIDYWFAFEITSFLWAFVILNIVNVIIQTYKSLITIKGTKMSAAIINAITYALYTVVVVFMSAEGLGLVWKALIIGIANFGGVYVVKWLEEKSRKAKLWKVEMTIPTQNAEAVHSDLKEVPHNYIVITDKYTLFNFYCATQEESKKVREVADTYHAKYFVSENKSTL